jgi:hypothetical protein
MIVPFVDTSVGSTVYVNPDYVVTLRPDPTDPENTTLVKTRDGECIHVKGDHREVASKLQPLGSH